MNKLEFKEVIDYFGYDFKGKERGKLGYAYGLDWDTYRMGPVTICFGDSYYTIVGGKVPLDVAKRIYRDYDNSKYHIRVNGGGDDWDPVSHAVDDIYNEEMENISPRATMDEYDKLEDELNDRDDKDKYIEIYHIDTMEGLIIFLNELLEKNIDYQEVFHELTKKVIKNNIDINKKIDLDKRVLASMNLSNNESKNKCRELIKEFDNLIFPYNKDIDILLDSFDINVDKEYDEMVTRVRDNTTEFRSEFVYGYNDHQFSYRIDYQIDHDTFYFFSHYIRDNKEYFVVSYKDSEEDMHMTYNLTDDKVARHMYEQEDATTSSDYELLKNELNNALYILNNLVFNKDTVKEKKI